jgi:hypothetical protein
VPAERQMAGSLRGYPARRRKRLTLDDYENKKVRRARGMPPDALDSNFIPPEQRGKRKCRDCNGRGGRYVVSSEKPNTAVYYGCKTCNMEGEVT